MLCFLVVRLLTEKLLGERFLGMVQVHEPVVYPRWGAGKEPADPAPVPLCGRVHSNQIGAQASLALLQRSQPARAVRIV